MQHGHWSRGLFTIIFIAGLVGLGGCASCGRDSGGGGDGGSDWCEDEGRYGDGNCDQCPRPDPDCGSVDPCYGRYGDGTCDTGCDNPDPDCGSVDQCEIEGLYGNGICDPQCPQPDPDCGGGTDTCADENRYGDGTCDACPDLDPDCQDLTADPCTGAQYGDGSCDACQHYDPDCAPAPPGAPGGVEATDSLFDYQVLVSWLPERGAAAYRVYRAESSGGPATALADLPATRDLLERPAGPTGEPLREAFSDTTAVPGTTYWYELTSLYSGGESGPSQRAAGSRALPDPGRLDPPENLRAIPTGTGGITLLWDPVPGAGAYFIYSANSVGGLASPGAQAGGTSETIWSLGVNAPGVTYWFGVTAAADFSSLEGPMSAPVSATLDPAPTLGAPANFVASQGFADRIDYSWDAVPGADLYRVYHQSTGSTAYTPVTGDVVGTMASYSGPLADELAYYYVRAFTLAGENSDFSARMAGGLQPLPAPENLAAVSTGIDSIQLSWDPLPEAASYVVLRGDSPVLVDQEIATPTATSFDDTGLSPDTPYYYAVLGVTASGRRGQTASWAQATTDPSILPPVTLSATSTLLDRITLGWDAVANATAYRVYRNDGGWVQVTGDITGTTHDDFPPFALLDQPVNYRVTAYNPTEGESLPGPSTTGIALRIAAPGGQNATTASSAGDTRPDTGIVISWLPVPQAIAYRIYRTATSAPSVVVGTEGAVATEHYDTGVELGYHYFYKVVALSPVGHESSRVGLVSRVGNTDALYALNNGSPLLGPSGVSLGYTTGTDSFDVSWTNVAGAGSYHLSRVVMDCTGGPCVPTANSLGLGEIFATSYNDGAAPTTDPCYSYLVSPVRSDGVWSIFATRSNTDCRP